MSQVSPRLLDESALKRLRVCADENTTLANCWDKSHVAMVTMEWAPLGFSYLWTSHIACNEVRGWWLPQDEMPVLSVEVMAPASSKAKGQPDGDAARGNPRRYTFWIRSQMALWGSARRSKLPAAPDTQVLYEPAAIVKKTLDKLFAELGREYSTICVCSHRPDQTRRALAELDFALPRNAVFVDLIRVLEYQSKFRPVPAELQKYVQSRLHVDGRNGGEFIEKFETTEGPDRSLDFYATAPKWGRDGEWVEVIRRRDDVSSAEMLGIVGAQAEVYRREIDRVEKESTAVERAARGLGKDEAKELRRAMKRELQKRKS